MDKSSCFLCSASAEINFSTNIEPKKFRIFQSQLFRLLLIPPEHLEGLQKLCTPERLCCQCLTVAEEIILLKKQILSLELKIQHKVETIGKGIVDKTSALELDTIDDVMESWTKEMEEWWIKFQYPVIQNFAKGYLPSPQVRIKKYIYYSSHLEPTVVESIAKQNPEIISSPLDESAASQEEEQVTQKTDDAQEVPLPCVNFATNIFEEEDPLPNSESSPLSLCSCNNNTEKTSTDEAVFKEDESIRCPVDEQCTYTIEYGRRSRRTRNYALKRLSRHYSHSHCEPKRWDIYTVNTSGQQCIPCKFCPFQALVKVQKALEGSADGRIPEDVMSRLRRNAIHVLIQHELKIHYLKLTPPKVGRKPNPYSQMNRQLVLNKQVPVPSPKWIQRVFQCPLSSCNFSYEFKWYGEDDDKNPQGLQRLGDHCLKYHINHHNMIEPRSHDMDAIEELECHYMTHVDVLDGIQHLRCPYPQCGSCIFILDKEASMESCRLFAEHYGAHMYKINKKSLCQISQIHSL